MNDVVSLFIQVLPLAIGAGMSPTFFAMQVVVITSPAPGAVTRGWALALGSVSMLLVISFGGVSLLNLIPRPDISLSSWSLVGLLLLGAIVLLLVARHEQRRPPDHSDAMLEKLIDAKPPFIFGVGALRLATNATTLAMYLPALHIIFSSQVNIAWKAVAFVLLFVLTEFAVVAPVLAVTLLGDRAKPYLTKAHDVMTLYAKPVMIGVCLLFAALMAVLALWNAWQLL